MKLSNLRALAEILGSRVLIVVFAAVTDVLVARVMTLESRGLFSSLQGSILLLAGLCTLGLEYGFLLTPDLPGLRPLLARYRRSAAVLVPLGAVLTAGFIWRYHLGLWQGVAAGLITAAEIFTILLLPLILQYRGSGSFGFVRILRRGLLFAGVGALALLPGFTPVSLEAALAMHALAWLIAAGFAAYYVARSVSGGGEATPPRLLTLWRHGANVFLAKYAERAHSKVGLLVLGMAGAAEAAAFFAVASLAVDLSIFIAGSLSIAVITRRDEGALLGGRELRLVSLAVIAMNLVVGVAIWFLTAPLVARIYGDAYLPVVPLVKLLVPGLVLYGAYPLYSTHLLKVRRTRLVLVGNFSALALNLAIGVLLMALGRTSPAQAVSIGLLAGLLVNVFSVGSASLRRR